MKKLKASSSRTPLIVGSLVILLLAFLGFTYFRTNVTPSPVDVFMIASDLVYGESSVDGVVSRNTQSNVTNAKYVLTLADGRSILLSGMDPAKYLGKSVVLTGLLTPAPGSYYVGFMYVENIEEGSK